MEFIKNHKNALTLFVVPQIMLLFLRLCEIINWSWFVVLIPIELLAGMIIISTIIGVIIGIIISIKKKSLIKKIINDYNRGNTSIED